MPIIRWQRGSSPRKKREGLAALPYLVKVVDGIYRVLPDPGEVSPEGALLVIDDAVVLFDSGTSYDHAAELRRFVDVVVNTHAHLGHTAKNYLFNDVWALESSVPMIEDIEKCVDFNCGIGSPIEGWQRDWMKQTRSDIASKVTGTFLEGDVLDFGNTRWQVVPTPGHCPGHCCFYEPNLRLLFAADVSLLSFGPYYGNPNGDLAAFKDSVLRLMGMDVRVAATTSKGPFYGDFQERLRIFYECFGKRDQLLLSSLREPSTLDELVNRFLICGRIPSWPPHVLHFAEWNMVEKHLRALVSQGAVSCRDGLFWAT